MIKILTKKVKQKLLTPKIADILNDIAEIVSGQIKEDVDKGVGVKGKLKALKASTIKAKRKRGSRNARKPLIDTGKMVNVEITKTATGKSLMSEIDVVRSMREIAEYHNTGAGHLPKRLWFGIGKKSVSRVNKVLRAKVRKAIKISLGRLK